MSESGHEEFDKSIDKSQVSNAESARINFEDGELQVRVGSSGVGKAMMQMNRITSLDADVAGLSIRIGSSGVGHAVMQMNAVQSVTLNVAGLEVGIGDEKDQAPKG